MALLGRLYNDGCNIMLTHELSIKTKNITIILILSRNQETGMWEIEIFPDRSKTTSNSVMIATTK